VSVRSRVERFVEEKFPEDSVMRWLIAGAIVVGSFLYGINLYFTAQFWWDLAISLTHLPPHP
jgi:hypothetical protein